MDFVFAGSAPVNSTPRTLRCACANRYWAAAQRVSRTSTPGRIRRARTLPSVRVLAIRKSAAVAPYAYPPMGWMYVTWQVVFTPRSNTTTGTPVWHAFSTAGVSATVVFGETMMASHLPASSPARSLICLSSLPPACRTVKVVISGCSFSSARIVEYPVSRHGLVKSALEKHTFHGGAFLKWVVSTQVGCSACSHGWSAGPSGVTWRCASWRSKSALTKNFELIRVGELGALAPAPVGLDEPDWQAASATRTAARAAAPRMETAVRYIWAPGSARIKVPTTLALIQPVI